MKQKIRLAIVFGGKSAEHEVSLQSALNVIAAVDLDRYAIFPVGISRSGEWSLYEKSSPFANPNDPERIALTDTGVAVSLFAGERGAMLTNLGQPEKNWPIDVVFPVLHGPFGEDGSIQGLAKLANLACAGSGILGSAVSMDKDIAKRLLRDAGIPVARHFCLTDKPGDDRQLNAIADSLNFPIFVKPANMGSSIGVAKVVDHKSLIGAIDSAFRYDVKVVLEAAIPGRELECAVLGNREPKASIVGEIITSDGFYSYQKKYIDKSGAALKIPAELDAVTQQQVQTMSVAAFRALECKGMARVDLFLSNAGKLFINEVNTLPGFTSISMYPKLWQASGIGYGELIDQLIRLALDEHDEKRALETC